MREQYYAIIKSKEIQDTLSWIEDMPYSKKTEILNDLLSVYDVCIINQAMADFEENYVRKHRVINHIVRNILVNLCKTKKMKEDAK